MPRIVSPVHKKKQKYIGPPPLSAVSAALAAYNGGDSAKAEAIKAGAIVTDAGKMSKGELKQYTSSSKKVVTDFDALPARIQKKIRKRYDHLAHKHPDLSEQEIMERIGRKLNLKLDLEA